jgi:peptidoglycan/LPS O-acetylase OafA/YrhL
VILVLLFHAKIPWFAGGYVGVDVFFVISGYLITSLILQDHAAGRFTLLGFYERRIRRIFPALSLVVLSTLAVGAFVMLPPDLARLGSSSVATTLFISNFYFLRQGRDYLRGDPDLQPLVHTWSLAIEEQFYVLFPLFVLGAIRILKRPGVAFIGVALGSFAISVYLTQATPQAAFYSSASRAWELLLGALIAVAGLEEKLPRHVTPVLQSAGLAMIFGAALSIDRHTPFPGLAALVPCVGAALILAWCHQETRLIRTLGHPALVWIGLISYPLYLWHWPLLVLAKLTLSRDLAAYEVVAVYLCAGFLAAFTWRHIEKPVRRRQGSISAKRLLALTAGAGCLAIAIGGALRATAGIWAATPANVVQVLEAAKDYAPLLGTCHNWDRKNPQALSHCVIGAREQSAFDFALLGDSHAGAIAIAVGGAANSVSKKGLQLTADDCPPLLRTQVRIQRVLTDCEARNEAALALLQQHGIRRVILASAWVQYLGDYKTVRPSNALNETDDNVASFRRALKDTIGHLRALGIDVTIVGPVPEIGWNVPAVLAAAEWHQTPPPEGPSLGDFVAGQGAIIPILKELEDGGVHVMHPHEVLCQSICIVRFKGQILYRDSEHLTTVGAELLRPMLVQQLSRASAVP